MTYRPIKKCQSFRDWLYADWDFVSGHCGTFLRHRTVGFRIFGFEHEYGYFETGEEL